MATVASELKAAMRGDGELARRYATYLYKMGQLTDEDVSETPARLQARTAGMANVLGTLRGQWERDAKDAWWVLMSGSDDILTLATVGDEVLAANRPRRAVAPSDAEKVFASFRALLMAGENVFDARTTAGLQIVITNNDAIACRMLVFVYYHETSSERRDCAGGHAKNGMGFNAKDACAGGGLARAIIAGTKLSRRDRDEVTELALTYANQMGTVAPTRERNIKDAWWVLLGTELTETSLTRVPDSVVGEPRREPPARPRTAAQPQPRRPAAARPRAAAPKRPIRVNPRHEDPDYEAEGTGTDSSAASESDASLDSNTD